MFCSLRRLPAQTSRTLRATCATPGDRRGGPRDGVDASASAGLRRGHAIDAPRRASGEALDATAFMKTSTRAFARTPSTLNLLKGHHCWVLRAFTSAFAHRRACRRSHEYSGDPFDPRRLLTVALYDNCSSQIALSNAPVRGGFWDLANCETWYSKTRGRVGSIFRPATPHPKKVGVDAAPSNSHLEPRTRAAREIRL